MADKAPVANTMKNAARVSSGEVLVGINAPINQDGWVDLKIEYLQPSA